MIIASIHLQAHLGLEIMGMILKHLHCIQMEDLVIHVSALKREGHDRLLMEIEKILEE